MRSRALAALGSAALAAAAGACAPRAQPYRFAMPMLGHADVPAELLPGDDAAAPPGTRRTPTREDRQRRPRERRAHTVYAYGWQRDAQSGIRTASAKGIELAQPEASAALADAVIRDGVARDVALRGPAWSRLRAPHRPAPELAAVGGVPPARTLREPADLRALIGVRDDRDPYDITTSWLVDLGIPRVETGAAFASIPDGPALVAWAEGHGLVHDRTALPGPGDILVFDRATSDGRADLLGIAIGRDARGVTEFIYAGGGVIRRGFVDATRPATRRDLEGAVVNTFLRHGKRWPPKGTRYLAGELLAHVIRAR